MKYNVPTNSPDDWLIVPDKNGEFETLKEAKQYLIDIAKAQIEDEKQMIKEVREFKLKC